jgi:FK506-binding protein 4/5
MCVSTRPPVCCACATRHKTARLTSLAGGMASLTSFSDVDISGLDLEDDESAGDETPSMHDFDEDGTSMCLVEDEDEEVWRVTSLDKHDVGNTYNVGSGPKHAVTKKLLDALAEPDVDNPANGWEVELTFTAKVVGDGGDGGGGGGRVFAHEVGAIMTLGKGTLPAGVEEGIRTMREGEHALLTIQPEKAFGASGDEAKGVPGGAVVEYDVLLSRAIQVRQLCGGTATKRRLVSGKRWERPSRYDELRCLWKGVLATDDRRIFQEETESTWDAGELGSLTVPLRCSVDASIPPALDEAACSMLEGEVAEVTVVPPVDGEVAAGFAAWGVPADTAVVLTVTMLPWVRVEDLSAAVDGSVRKRVLARGDGWEKPRDQFVVTLDVEARTERSDAAPVASATALDLTVGQVGGSEAVVGMRAACGGADVGAALELVVKHMAQGEYCEVRCAQSTVGGIAKELILRVRLLSWVVVEPVPHSDSQIIRRLLGRCSDADEGRFNERPNFSSEVTVKYTVRLAAAGGGGGGAETIETTGDTPRTFVLNGESSAGVLPCVILGVQEMRRGERCLFTAPAEWAYSSPEYAPPPADGSPGAAGAAAAATAADAAGGGVEVEVELVEFVRGKDLVQMTGNEKLAWQSRCRAVGNSYYKAGRYVRAVKRYEESNRAMCYEKNFQNDGESADVALPKVSESQKAVVSCHLNISQCHLKLAEGQEEEGTDKRGEREKSLRKAIAACTQAIKIQPASLKALFRRGQARMKLGDFDGARHDLMDAARLEPQNKEVRSALAELKAQQATLRQQQKGMFGGMFASS